MFEFDYHSIINSIYSSVMINIEFYAPKILWALLLLVIWMFIAVISYKFVKYAFKKFKLIELIDKLTIDFEDIANIPESKWKEWKIDEIKKVEKPKKFSQRVKLDEIFGKAIWYYIFLAFFRLSIVIIGIEEVEKFLADLLTYLPSLFIAVVILFFWVRFANFYIRCNISNA